MGLTHALLELKILVLAAPGRSSGMGVGVITAGTAETDKLSTPPTAVVTPLLPLLFNDSGRVNKYRLAI